MPSNSQILTFKISDSLHLKLKGDFDVNSAQEVINSLLTYGVGNLDIFIDPNDLKTIDPLGKIAYQMNIRNFEKPLNNLFFVGENKHKITPNYE